MLQTFNYLAPHDEATFFQTLKDSGVDQPIPLAGGTDLLADIRGGKVKPTALIDLKRVAGFNVISLDPKTGLAIGPAVTCADIISNDFIAAKYPILAEAAALIGSKQLRNRATAVGNICTASPCADLATALLSLDATLELKSEKGSRIVELRNFFLGPKRGDLKSGEIVRRIIVPARMAHMSGGIKKLKRIKGHDLAIASVVLVKNDSMMQIAIGSCAPTPIVLRELSAKITVQKAVESAMAAIKPIDDLRATKEYRRFMVQTFIERLFEEVNG